MTQVSFKEAFLTWAKIGLLSFGGPAGQIAIMHRILVEEKKWINEASFLHALNYCMLLPGPEAQQLATYIGWLLHKTKGGLTAGILFIVPGIIAIMLLSVIYALWGKIGLVAALFFGLKTAVLAIVLQAVQRIGKKALKNNMMKAIAMLAFIAIFFANLPFPLIILIAGIAGFLGGKNNNPSFMLEVGHGTGGKNEKEEQLPSHLTPSLGQTFQVSLLWLGLWLIPVFALYSFLGSNNVFSEIGFFFSKMAVVTFGGAYAVLAYVAQEAVANYHWLKQGEMLDGLGMAETTPGPLIMVLQFVGFMAAFRDPGSLSPLVAGIWGGLLATWVTFTPCFLWIFLGAPFVEKLRANKAIAAALATITAAVVGVVLNLAIWFALNTIFQQTETINGLGGAIQFSVPVFSSLDWQSLGLTIIAVFMVFRLKAGMLTTLAITAGGGVALYLGGIL